MHTKNQHTTQADLANIKKKKLIVSFDKLTKNLNWLFFCVAYYYYYFKFQNKIEKASVIELFYLRNPLPTYFNYMCSYLIDK